MRERLLSLLRESFIDLRRQDGLLFGCPGGNSENGRKLHEVCINHKLATHLEKRLPRMFPDIEEEYYVDIEFNRQGINPKTLEIDGETKTVRPDIIIHNRKSGSEKRNVLIVECKKVGAGPSELADDREKILAFLTDAAYQYDFGLQVIYSASAIQGTLFYKAGNSVREMPV